MEQPHSMYKVAVLWRGIKYMVEISSDSTLRDLGQELLKLTEVKADTMRLIVPKFSSQSSKMLYPFSDEDGCLNLQNVQFFEDKPIRMMGVPKNEVDEVLQSAKKNERIAGFNEEEKRLKQRMSNKPHTSLRLPGGPYTFCDFRTLQIPGVELSPPASEALKRMHMLAADPGIVAIMNKHRWRVGIMTEMAPVGYVGVSPKCILGLNKNQGEEISLRLRTDDLKGFRKYESIKKTLLHELAHMVFSEHDANFYALDKQLNEEAATLDWTRSKGYTLTGVGHSQHYEDDYDVQDSINFSQKLGGSMSHQPASARASSVAAAYHRLKHAPAFSSDVSKLTEEPDPDDCGLILSGNEEGKVLIPNPNKTMLNSHCEPDPDDSFNSQNKLMPDPDDSSSYQKKLEPDPDDKYSSQKKLEPDPDESCNHKNKLEHDIDDSSYNRNKFEPDPDDSGSYLKELEHDPDDRMGIETFESECILRSNENRVVQNNLINYKEMQHVPPGNGMLPESIKLHEPDPDDGGIIFSNGRTDSNHFCREMQVLDGNTCQRMVVSEPDPDDMEEKQNILECGDAVRSNEAYGLEAELVKDETHIQINCKEGDADDSQGNVPIQVEPDPDANLVHQEELSKMLIDEPDPDDQEIQRIQDSVNVVCNRMHEAIAKLMAEVKSSESSAVFQTLFKIVKNLSDHPNEMKYRKLRKANPIIQKNVANYKAAMEILSLIGFIEDVLLDEIGKSEAFLVLKRNDPGLLWLAKSTLENCSAF